MLEHVPAAVVERLPLYLRCLLKLEDDGYTILSSKQIGDRLAMDPARIRKDLAYFGEFGIRGTGYVTADLIYQVRKILGLHKVWNMCVVGAGHLGSALAGYGGFAKHGLRTAALFDIDPRKVGKNVAGLIIQPMEEFMPTAGALELRVGIITVPGAAAQQVCDLMVRAGLKGIWNFASARVSAPEGTKLRHEDLTLGLMSLSHYVAGVVAS